MEHIAKIVNFSKFHFHRIFKTVSGETLSGYIRRLRLESAASFLATELDKSVTEVAFECNFSSSQSFAKAFKSYFEMTPTEFRDQYRLGVQEPPVFTLDEKNLHPEINESSFRLNKNLDVTPTEISSFKIAYIESCLSDDKRIYADYEKLLYWAYEQNIGMDARGIGVMWDNPDLTVPESCRYDLGLEITKPVELTNEIREQEIEGGLYAVHNCIVAHNDFESIYTDLFFDWLPGSGYIPEDKPSFELYLNDGYGDKLGRWIVDIYIPIKKIMD